MLDEFKKDVFTSLIKSGGKLASKEQGDARVNVCNSCEHKGTVEPLPTLKLDGCLLCKCPFVTKAYMLTMLGSVIECPYPGENKWLVVDKLFT